MPTPLPSGQYVADNANLSGSTFHNVNLAQASFEDINLSQAKYDNINFSGATFHNVTLKGASFREICLDDVSITTGSSCVRASERRRRSTSTMASKHSQLRAARPMPP